LTVLKGSILITCAADCRDATVIALFMCDTIWNSKETVLNVYVNHSEQDLLLTGINCSAFS
jgi:hypothetical protein